ncbi:MAG: hypothetical protein A2Y15_07295 [Clostridiales bacterium GWF2_36_10]|nr:MAG: hypothetical protein A2Y15_07295 [Clostridiales bacterium GWF2_36_10]HAN21309.1 hypothetical protein [Clostridiales bacterium]
MCRPGTSRITALLAVKAQNCVRKFIFKLPPFDYTKTKSVYQHLFEKNFFILFELETVINSRKSLWFIDLLFL